MNNKIIILFLFLFSGSFYSTAQDWEKTFFHNNSYANAYDVIQTTDNGYAMIGEVDLATGAIRHYIWVIKTDANGNQLWSNIFNEIDVTFDCGRAIHEMANGDLVIVGSTWGKAKVIKMNATGDVLWTRNFGGEGFNVFRDVIQNINDQLVLVGQYEASSNSGQREVWAMGMTTDGDSLWSVRYFQPTDTETTAHEITALSDNDFLITGAIGGQGFAMQINGTDGEPGWSNNYPLGSGGSLYSGVQNQEGTSLLLGGTAAGFAGFSPILYRTNLSGATTGPVDIFPVSFGSITSLAPTMDNGFMMTGSSFEFYHQIPATGFISKLDANLELEWQLTFSDSLSKQGATIRQNPDGSFILAGSRNGGMWLKKITGNPTSIQEMTKNDFGIMVFPNPASRSIQIDLPEHLARENLSFDLFDASGKLILRIGRIFQNRMIDTGHLPMGIYQYSIRKANRPLAGGSLILE